MPPFISDRRLTEVSGLKQALGLARRLIDFAVENSKTALYVSFFFLSLSLVRVQAAQNNTHLVALSQ